MNSNAKLWIAQYLFALALLFFSPMTFGHSVVFISEEGGEGTGTSPVVIADDHLDVLPEVVDFSTVGVGRTATHVIRVSNNTTSKMDVFAALEGHGFSLDSDFVQLAPAGDLGSTRVLNVTFSPTEVGHFSGRIVFLSAPPNTEQHDEDMLLLTASADILPSLRITERAQGTPLDTLDFRDLEIGQFDQLHFDVHNDGPTRTIGGGLLQETDSEGCLEAYKPSLLCFVLRDFDTLNVIGPISNLALEPFESVIVKAYWEPADAHQLSETLTLVGGDPDLNITTSGIADFPPGAGILEMTDLRGQPKSAITLTEESRDGEAAMRDWVRVKNVGESRVLIRVLGVGGNGCIDDNYINKCFQLQDGSGLGGWILEPGQSDIMEFIWYYSPGELTTTNFELTLSTNADQQLPLNVTAILPTHKESAFPGPETGLLGFEDQFDSVRGLFNENSFQSYETDSVSHLNGNLSVNIPIGQSFSVGPNLNYQLNLSYNSNGWNRVALGDYGIRDIFESLTFTIPVPTNAGFGWNLSLGGELYASSNTTGWGPPEWPNTDQMKVWQYVDETGTPIGFIRRSGDPEAHAYYSTGSGFMRIVGDPNSEIPVRLELGNGVTKTFERNANPSRCRPYNGQPERCWRLSRIADQYGNYVVLSYQPDGLVRINISSNGEPESSAREILVKFKYSEVMEPHLISGLRELASARTHVEYVELPAFDIDPNDDTLPRSRWTFDLVPGGNEPNGLHRIVRACPGDFGQLPEEFSYVSVPLLRSVRLPDGSDYRFETLFQTQGICDSHAGKLESVTNPTSRTINYRFANVFLPTPCGGGPDAPEVLHNLGVHHRFITDRNIGRRYESELFSYTLEDRGVAPDDVNVDVKNGGREVRAKYDGQESDHCARANTMKTHVVSERAIPGTVTGAGENMMANYRHDIYYHTVTTSHLNHPSTGVWKTRDYGLPINKRRVGFSVNGHTPYLSKLTAVCREQEGPSTSIDVENDPACDASISSERGVKMHEYKAYAYHQVGLQPSACPEAALRICTVAAAELQHTRMVYPPFIPNGDITPNYVDTWRSDYDGLGHFRRETMTALMPGIDSAVSTTRYNPSFDPVVIENAYISTLYHWPPDTPWITGTYDQMTSEISGQKKVSEYEFNEAGSLVCERALANLNGTRSDRDIARSYSHSYGFVTLEQSAGGDAKPLVDDTMCPTSSDHMEFRVKKAYAAGVLVASEHLNQGGATIGVPSVDAAIDIGTGLVRELCDHSRSPVHCMTNNYDQLGRLTNMTPVNDNAAPHLEIRYEYGIPHWIRVKRTDYSQGSAIEVENAKFFIDDLGREIRVEQEVSDERAPSGRLVQFKHYHPQGWLSSYTIPTDAYVWASYSQPAKQAARYSYPNYDYDGRALRFKNPANEEIRWNYPTAPQKSTSIANRRTVERLDYLGRVVKITEEGGDGLSDRVTESTFTLGLNVTSRGAQVRRSHMDGRGFLKSEEIPEYTEAVSYEYNSRGDVTRRIGNGRDVVYRYNGVGLLEEVWVNDELVVSREYDEKMRPLKAHRYQTVTSSDTHGLIDIWLHGAGNSKEYTITDHYQQYGPHGQVERKAISVTSSEFRSDGTPHAPHLIDVLEMEFIEETQYDVFGRLVSTTIPSCSGEGAVCGDSKGVGLATPLNIQMSYELNDLIGVHAAAGLDESHQLLSYEYFADGSPRKVAAFELSTGNALAEQIYDNMIVYPESTSHPPVYFPRRYSHRVNRFDHNEDGEVEQTEVWSSGVHAYNAAGQVSTIGASHYTYDRFGRLKGGDGQAFIYDQYDNILSGVWESNIDPTNNRILDANVRGNMSDAVYDNDGNLLELGCIKIGYDELNMQRSWSCIEGLEDYSAFYLMNADGRRIVAVDRADSGNNNVIISPSPHRTFYINSDGTMAAKTMINQTLVTESEIGGSENQLVSRHLIKDRLGSLRVAVSSDVSNVDSYTPYGYKTDPQADQIGESAGFAGHSSDRNNGNSNGVLDGDGWTMVTPARTYMQVLGRFAQVDPAHDGWNRYAYAGNDPMNKFDPTGLSGQPVNASRPNNEGVCTSSSPCIKPAPDVTERLWNFGTSLVAIIPDAFQSAVEEGSVSGGGYRDIIPSTVGEAFGNTVKLVVDTFAVPLGANPPENPIGPNGAITNGDFMVVQLAGLFRLTTLTRKLQPIAQATSNSRQLGSKPTAGQIKQIERELQDIRWPGAGF